VNGDKAALIAPSGSRTFAGLEDRAARLTRVLRDRGAGPAERVALMLANSCEWFETNVAVARLGAQLVPVNWHLRRDEVAWILADSDARVLVTDVELAPDVDATVAALPRCSVLRVGADYDAEIARAAPVEPDGGTRAAVAPAVVLYTSGTTGRPKGVVHEQSTTARSRQTHVDLWGFTGDDVHLLVGPAYHGAPWSYAVTHLALGATVVVMARWDAREFLRLVERHRVTNTFVVPTHFARLLEIPEAERTAFDRSSLRLVLHGAAACPVAVKARALDFLAPAEVWEFYGFSEAGRVSRIGPDEWRAHPGSAGRPFDGVHVVILDDAGNEVPTGETGWIHVVPAHGDRFHYRNNPGATAAVTAATRFGPAVTGGDLGHLDADGYLSVTDRSAELVVRGGVNVYPREAEDALHAHPAVVDCAVFGVPDAVYGERLLALVEVAPGSDLDAPSLDAHVRERLAAYKCPEEIRIVATLPRDPNGKVRKAELRDVARRDQGSQETGVQEPGATSKR
jgi:long-chain acyl-CoA synthetase